jgi:ParB family chromosome partitioning protein
MTSLLLKDADAARLLEVVDAEATEAAADSAAPVPPDLLAPPQRPDVDRAPIGPSPSANAVSALRGLDAAAPAPHGTAVAAEPKAAPAARHGPRLERVPTLAIRPAATVPRRRLEAADLEALATSIRHNGLAQPLLVRINPARPGIYELFAGYRRWRAALIAEVAHVPVIVFDGLGEAVALELSVLENLHRRDLTIIEEAEALRMLADQFGRTHEQIATLTGRSRSQVTNLLRLLALPDEVKDTLHQGRISYGHGRALLSAAMPAALARRIVAERLTVRETELLAAQLQPMKGADSAPEPAGNRVSLRVARPNEPKPAAVAAEVATPSELLQLQAELAEALGVDLDVRSAQEGSALMIRGRSAQEMTEVIAVLRDGLKLLRMNRAIDVLSRDLRAV